MDLPPQPAVETIFVSSQPITTAAGTEAFGAVWLDADALSPASGRVEDGLRALGGVQLFRAASTRTANPTAAGITARGLAGNAASRLEVTLDGAPLADPFFGFIGWGSLTEQKMAAGELIRGGGLGGPGALAGTLALTSALPATQAMARGGSRGSFDAEAMLAAPIRGGALGVSGGFARGDGHHLVATPGAADVPARYRQWSLAGVAHAAIGEAMLVARVGGFSDWRRRGVEGADIESRGGDASLSLSRAGRWSWGVVAHAKLRDFATVNRPLDAARATASTALNQIKTPASGWGVETWVEPSLGNEAAVRLGLGWREAEGRTIEHFRFVNGTATSGRSAGGTQQVGSAYLNGSLRATPDLLLTAAGRLDHWRQGEGRLHEFDLATGITTLDAPSAARHGTEASGRVGALWRPAPAISLRAAGYRGWRLPTLNELYRPFRAGADATAANPQLSPERLWGAEAGFGWQLLDAAELSVTGFWNRLDRPIANVTLAQGPGNFPGVGFVGAAGQYRQRQNLHAIESRGLEADARLAAGPWSLTASAAYVDAQVLGGALDGMRPAQAPAWSGSLAAGWAQAGWRAHATLRHFGKRYEDDQNARRLPPATTLDAMIGVPLAHGVSLELAAENLTDARIATGFSGSQYERGQPRTLWAGLRWQPR